MLPFTKLVPFTVIFGVPLITVLVELLTMAFAEPLIGALVELLTVPFGEPLTVPDLARPPPLVLLNSVVGTIFVAWPLVPYFARNFGVLLTKNFSFFDAPYLGSFTLEIDAEKLRSGTIIAMSMTNQKPSRFEPLGGGNGGRTMKFHGEVESGRSWNWRLGDLRFPAR